MARLNEPPAPMDAVEILRRKYSRQNKEIARINSTQCVRIRNLENEVSRLLAENLDLRGKIIQQEAEAESGGVQHVVDHVSKIKTDLEAKLSELGTLITTLAIPPPRRKSPENRVASSPARKNWKNAYSMTEAMAGQEGRLPSILEDKQYPRRTLNSTEIEALVSDPITDTTESPDIGPPPVSKFVNQDPVKIDFPMRSTENEESTPIDPVSSVNLEQRKKRKDPVVLIEQKRPSRFEPRTSINGSDRTQPIKSGAKRKMGVRDDEDETTKTAAQDSSSDDFKFTRRSNENKPPGQARVISEKPGSKSQREFAVPKGVAKDPPALPNRKVLVPKSTNVDVSNSPKKNMKSEKGSEINLLKENASTQSKTGNEETQKGRLRSIPVPYVEPLVPPIAVVVEPETPAATDMFSPLSSGSTGDFRAESRDTPPPPDLGPGMEGHRPSRRVRGAVSYAEPNLRDKMRRPTKELVDAVTADNKATKPTYIKTEHDSPLGSILVKMEPLDDAAWKSKIPSPIPNKYGNSPLADKNAPRETIAGEGTTHRRRRISSAQSGSDGEAARPNSISSISALLAERRKAKQEVKDKEILDSRPLEQALADLAIDIYEFGGSPADQKENMGKEEKTLARVSRRASLLTQEVSSSAGTGVSDGETLQRSTSSISSRRRQSVTAAEIGNLDLHGGPALTLGRRRQSNLGLGQQIDLDVKKVGDPVLKKSGGVISHAAPQEDAGSRTERVTARRRSMML